ncbi:MAG TPA: cell envelope integrity EipB family protein [Xanthobacteraceae bacterium]|nr:cell envelope integrity EipB family protein [Xanthobacteraceae bacterium]
MTPKANGIGAAAAVVCLLTIICSAGPAPPARALATTAVELASHRAVYELTLAQAHGSSQTVSARGRILYDFAGSACEGYKLEFRQVSELDNGEGKVTLSDLRSNTWEDAEANNYHFKSENYLNNRLTDQVDGEAVRQAGDIQVSLTKPRQTKISLDHAIVFPTEHVRRIIDAARAGKTILEFPVYDGSERGDKIYNTLTVIGRAIPGNERVPTDAAAGQQALAGMTRWPVTVSYFERNSGAGEQTPIYSISFELYENGISRALLLDYNDFAISGELTSLEIRDAKPCP